ncbi:MAG: hypothetical protein BWY42_01437 [Candidatus Omnitrophica bacterium ADurb.Bin277]|nr:MAG: hypothetical protein BWY42_01437 [Candidatus Omnitrophica bacterium ADurb.Bin277]
MDHIREILPAVIRELETPEKANRSRLVSGWLSIAGRKLAAHTKPQLTGKGVLYVHVDEPVLAFEINQKYRLSLLKRAQAALGEKTVKELKVLVGK